MLVEDGDAVNPGDLVRLTTSFYWMSPIDEDKSFGTRLEHGQIAVVTKVHVKDRREYRRIEVLLSDGRRGCTSDACWKVVA